MAGVSAETFTAAKSGPGAVKSRRGEGVELGNGADRRRVREARRPGDAGEIDAAPGVRTLHARLAIVLVVEHHDGEIRPAASTAMVASEPSPISISPSPVTTTTRRRGCARASPRPVMAAPPMAAHRSSFSGVSPAAATS